MASPGEINTQKFAASCRTLVPKAKVSALIDTGNTPPEEQLAEEQLARSLDLDGDGWVSGKEELEAAYDRYLTRGGLSDSERVRLERMADKFFEVMVCDE